MKRLQEEEERSKNEQDDFVLPKQPIPKKDQVLKSIGGAKPVSRQQPGGSLLGNKSLESNFKEPPRMGKKKPEEVK